MYYILNCNAIIIIIIDVYLWAEYLELVLPNYYMITSQHFPDYESSDDKDRFIEGIWCLHYVKNTYGTFYYPNGTKVAVFTGTFNYARRENNYTGPDMSLHFIASPKAGDMSLSLISTPRYVDSPIFNLRFIVTNGPPTNVTCTGPNSYSITQTSDDLSREVVNVGTATLVTVTVKMREEGNYQCTVSNARVEDGTINGVTAAEGNTSLTVTG